MHEADCAAVDDVREGKVVRDVSGGARPASPASPATADDVRDMKVVRDVRGGARPASHACPACLQL